MKSKRIDTMVSATVKCQHCGEYLHLQWWVNANKNSQQAEQLEEEHTCPRCEHTNRVKAYLAVFIVGEEAPEFPTDEDIEEMANEVPIYPPLLVSKEHRAHYKWGARQMRDRLKKLWGNG
jgi:NMD protein affecting ribosome stability and mRNA decay